jgi:hypothetical protein
MFQMAEVAVPRQIFPKSYAHRLVASAARSGMKGFGVERPGPTMAKVRLDAG